MSAERMAIVKELELGYVDLALTHFETVIYDEDEDVQESYQMSYEQQIAHFQMLKEIIARS